MILACPFEQRYFGRMRSWVTRGSPAACSALLLLSGCSSDDPAGLAPGFDAGAQGGQGGGAGVEDSGSSAEAGLVEGGSVGPNLDAGDGSGPPLPPAEAGPPQDSGSPAPICIPDPGAALISPPDAPSADAGTPQCWGMTWGAGSPSTGLGASSVISGAADDLLRSITPDELKIAWLAPPTEGNSQPVVHYATRHYPTDPFDTVQTLDPGPEADVNQGFALSPDGLRLIMVLPDHKGFTEYVRNGDEDPFSATPLVTQFDTLNTQISHYVTGALVGDPVLSGDDLTFYYSVTIDGSADGDGGYQHSGAIYSSTRIPYVAWPAGDALAAGDLFQADCDLGRRPTGVSGDQLTLFYWDELSGSLRAAFRSGLDQPFNGAVDLGDRPGGQPNADCTHLYYSGAGVSNDTDILMAD